MRHSPDVGVKSDQNKREHISNPDFADSGNEPICLGDGKTEDAMNGISALMQALGEQALSLKIGGMAGEANGIVAVGGLVLIGLLAVRPFRRK